MTGKPLSTESFTNLRTFCWMHIGVLNKVSIRMRFISCVFPTSVHPRCRVEIGEIYLRFLFLDRRKVREYVEVLVLVILLSALPGTVITPLPVLSHSIGRQVQRKTQLYLTTARLRQPSVLPTLSVPQRLNWYPRLTAALTQNDDHTCKSLCPSSKVNLA